jgi:hypothetical protein
MAVYRRLGCPDGATLQSAHRLGVGVVRGIGTAVGAVDAFQRRTRPVGFLYGVVKKFGNDNGGMLAGLMTYYGF